MRIRCGYNIGFDCEAPTPMVLMLGVHPDRRDDLETPDTMITSTGAPTRCYLDFFGNRCTRLLAQPGPITLSADFVIRDSGQPDPVLPDARLADVDDLPDGAIQYLLSSRYCEIDRMSELAWRMFGNTEPGWSRVQAIVDYVHKRIEFGYHHARPTKSAWEAHEERRGVCRDFAHLAITLCRSMNVPARYCTGYLGEMGVTPTGAPMDFSAWFEVFLDGAWRTFDARHNTPRIGRVVLARGRDASDVAITTTFGTATLTRFEVITEELAEEGAPQYATG